MNNERTYFSSLFEHFTTHFVGKRRLRTTLEVTCLLLPWIGARLRSTLIFFTLRRVSGAGVGVRDKKREAYIFSLASNSETKSS